MKQRIRDWLHERRLAVLSRELATAMQRSQWNAAAEIEKRFREAHAQRSPGQVARMERRMGLRPRATIKRRIMAAFLRGRVPSPIVTAVFRLLRLRSL